MFSLEVWLICGVLNLILGTYLLYKIIPKYGLPIKGLLIFIITLIIGPFGTIAWIILYADQYEISLIEIMDYEIIKPKKKVPYDSSSIQESSI